MYLIDRISYRTKNVYIYIYGLLSDLPKASAGLGIVDGEGGGHDLCQLERADHVQHQTAQVRHLLVNTVDFL